MPDLYEFRQQESPLYAQPYSDDCEWDWRNNAKRPAPLATVTIDGHVVPRVLWCNVRTGIALVIVCGADGHALQAPGTLEVATAVVQGKIVVTPL